MQIKNNGTYQKNFYNNLYTRTGTSRIGLNMQALTIQNLPYRINDIRYQFLKTQRNWR